MNNISLLIILANRGWCLNRIYLRFGQANAGESASIVSICKTLISVSFYIGDENWLGRELFVVGGIGVNRSVPPFCLVAGVPAKVVRQFDQTTKVCCGQDR